MSEETNTFPASSKSDALSSPPVVVQTTGNGRTPLWVLLGVAVGFLLPVCSCALLIFVSVASLGTLGAGTTRATGAGDAVALIRVDGPIVTGDDADFSSALAISGQIIADLRAAAEDATVKAIVLRVDSPGGTVTGATQIYEELARIDKPIVVSMIASATSGAYYISTPADYIFARPETITGSLGVIITLYNAEELLDKVGVEVITITSGDNKTIGSPWELLTPEQQAIFESIIDEAYGDFVQVIADGRDLPISQVRQLADGRIFTGRQALSHGLVDELGNLEDAISKAAELGGIVGEPRIVEYERLPTFSQLLGGLSNRLARSDTDLILETIVEFTTPRLEYRYIGR